MKRCYTNHGLLTIVAVLLAGCQQPTGPGVPAPLTPGLPMNGTTRVPPPPTGHVGTPNPYVQGQAAAATPTNHLLAAATSGQRTADADAAPSLDAATSSSGSPIQAVSYVESSSLGPAMATPSIPAEAFVGDLPPRGDDVPLRPHLRGMEPINLVPVQQASATVGTAAPTASVSLGVQGERGSPAAAEPYRASSQPASSGDGWDGADAASTVPSTEPHPASERPAADSATQTVGDTLPWRKPSTAH